MLSFLSLNSRGLKNSVKRKATFLFCKEQKTHLIFLQETHSAETDVKFWKQQWGDSVFFSHGTSHSAGVMILLNRFSGTVIDHMSDAKGHWLMVVIELDFVSYILINVYGYNQKTLNKSFFSSLKRLIESWKVSYSTEKIVIGGDFNLAPDLWLDRLPPKGQSHNYDETITEFTSQLNLVDYWRVKHPYTSQFTWFNSASNGQCSRLDYWLISNNLISDVSNCEISASPLTDHCMVTLSLQYQRIESKAISVWKFNNSLLENTEFCKEVKKMVKEISDLDLSPLSKWEWFKFKIKESAIRLSKHLNQIKKQRQHSIISEINKLGNNDELTVEEHLQLNKLQAELDNLYLEKAKGAYIRSRARWIEEGEKNSSYFFSLEKQRQTKKRIQKLIINDVNIDSQETINEEIKVFYENLYRSRFSEESKSLFFGMIQTHEKKLDDDFMQIMEEKLKIEELDNAIKQMSKGKSPGLDGLTVEFYTFFWSDIRRMLFNALTECISNGHLSPTMKRGLITLLPKPNKNKLSLENWRPITLLCNDYKMLAHVYSNRLDCGITKLVDECQSAFIKGRNIHNHTRLILDMLDYSDYIDSESFVLFLDFYKAFDSVEHPFLLEALNFLGFGKNFYSIVKMFYTDISSCVSLNPGMTPRFMVSRGIRQGCPISPKLFILATQLLTILIQQQSPEIEGITIFDKEFKLSQFADDTSIFLKNKSMVGRILNKISLFSNASGLSLNIKKCELLPIHECPDSTIEQINVVSEVKYLGITISKNLIRREDVNVSSHITDVKKSLSRWLSRDLTIFGRIILSKAEGISKLIYPCHSLYVSPKNIKKANSVIFQFLWRNKTHYLRRSQLVKDYERGGVKALDFEAMVGTFRINWIKACLSQPDSIWFHIPRSLFSKIGGLEFLLKCDFEVGKISVKLSNFHKQILNFWKMLFKHNFSPHRSTLWNNRVILSNRRSLFKQSWFEKGIVFVTDLLDDTGNVFDFASFLNKYGLNCHAEFMKVCKAIPLPLIHLIKSALMYGDIETALPVLVIEDYGLLDKKCNNKFISAVFKSRSFNDYHRGLYSDTSQSLSLSTLEKAHSNYIKWPIPPKVKETHFKLINKIYPTAEFLRQRFKFEVDPCAFCNESEESLDHMFLLCPVSQTFWREIRDWLSLKMNDIPKLEISNIIFYIDTIDKSVSLVVNVILLLAKYHIHCCKWRKMKPSFQCFLNDFKLFFVSIKKIKSNNSAKKLLADISKYLLF